MQGLVDVRQGRLDQALENLSDLVLRQPDFRLAQLVYGDILLASAGRLTSPRLGLSDPRLREYRDEARARLNRYFLAPPPRAVPDSLLRVAERTAVALAVDLERNRMFLFENNEGDFVRTRDFYISIGKGGADKQREGDDKTPIGVYQVASFLPGKRLPDMYGEGAFPLDYPNAWDRRRGRSGSGIWIHGTESDRYSRPPLSSEGCVTLSNEDFRLLMSRVEVGETPVVVTRDMRWTTRDELAVELDSIEEALEDWRRDWESLDTERYLSHYAQDFVSGRMSREAFADYKRRVNRRKRYVEVDLDEVDVFRYPGETDLVLVRFVQRYRSNNFQVTKRKNQYWRREADAWRIVLEENARG